MLRRTLSLPPAISLALPAKLASSEAVAASPPMLPQGKLPTRPRLPSAASVRPVVETGPRARFFFLTDYALKFTIFRATLKRLRPRPRVIAEHGLTIARTPRDR